MCRTVWRNWRPGLPPVFNQLPRGANPFNICRTASTTDPAPSLRPDEIQNSRFALLTVCDLQSAAPAAVSRYVFQNPRGAESANAQRATGEALAFLLGGHRGDTCWADRRQGVSVCGRKPTGRAASQFAAIRKFHEVRRSSSPSRTIRIALGSACRKPRLGMAGHRELRLRELPRCTVVPDRLSRSTARKS